MSYFFESFILFFFVRRISGENSQNIHPELDYVLKMVGYSSWKEAADAADQTVPTYYQFLKQSFAAALKSGGGWNCSGRERGPHSPQVIFTPENVQFFLSVIVLAIAITIVRVLLSPKILRWAKRAGLKAEDAAKVPESVFKGFAHGTLWLLSLYVVVLSGRHKFFQQSCRIWDPVLGKEDVADVPLQSDIVLVYALQFAFYVHSVYATLYMDVWRKDSAAMMIHHGVAISLIVFSFFHHFIPVGVLVFFLHDISDVLLEFTKVTVYFKSRSKNVGHLNKFLSDAGFCAFTISWVVFRLYWYPLKVLNASTWCVFLHYGCTNPYLYIPGNLLMWGLQLLHLYWFWFILSLLFKILTGQMKELEDIRDDDAPSTKEDKIDLKKSTKSIFNSHDHIANGHVSNVNGGTNHFSSGDTRTGLATLHNRGQL
ncbi:unnamed protein product [Calicophoron daubneyi]|uniref:TLC domain-containing protein n=1 Tax=Calicophoron daubneyi TaxID=300641 RepID=A0AAV2T240_CALDB